MDVGKALTYTFDDDRWIVKLLIGAALLLFSWLIIPAIFVEGYMIRIVRNVMNNEVDPLPEWDEWGDMFRDGLNVAIGILVYSIPIWLLGCCAVTVFAPAGFTEGDTAEMMAILGGGTSLVLICLMAILGIILAVLAPAIILQYAREGTLGACFQFGEVIGIARQYLGDIIITLLVLIGVGIAIGLVSGVIAIIPFIGWIISWLISVATGIYLTFVSGHLYGQIGEKMGGAPKEKPLDATM